MKKYKGILASSSDETGQTLSKTIEGLVTILSAVVPLLALQLFHVTITAADIGMLVTQVTTIIGAILAVRGLILKVLASFKTE